MKTEKDSKVLKEESETVGKKLKKISENDLNNVAGGTIYSTALRCDNCGFETVWAGDYMNSGTMKCPICARPAFHAIRPEDWD